MGKLIGLFLLSIFTLNTTNGLESCTFLTSQDSTHMSETFHQDHPTGGVTSDNSAPLHEDSNCSSEHCTHHCHAGHCHYVGMVTLLALVNDPKVDSVLVATQSSRSIILQKDTRPPRA